MSFTSGVYHEESVVCGEKKVLNSSGVLVKCLQQVKHHAWPDRLLDEKPLCDPRLLQPTTQANYRQSCDGITGIFSLSMRQLLFVTVCACCQSIAGRPGLQQTGHRLEHLVARL